MITSDVPIIIIPDIHGETFWRKALSFLQKGHLVFLGDYLDPYDNEEGITSESAFYNLLDILDIKRKNPDRVSLLWGNHDLHYLYKNLKGSRYDYSNSVRFNQFFWQYQDFFQYAEDAILDAKRYLFTHAGVGRMWASKVSKAFINHAPTASELNSMAHSRIFIESLGAIPCMRGGWSEYGSMLWADSQEQYNVVNQYKEIIQVFGHTHRNTPLNIDNRIYCIDCCQCFIINPVTGQIEAIYQ